MVSGIFLSFCSTIVLAVKRSALTWCKLFHLGNRVDFCVASYKEHPFSSCQNGTLMMLWGIPHFILQLEPIYLQAPGKRHVTLDEPIRTGCSPSPRPPPIVIGSGMGTWPIRDKKMRWDFFFFFSPLKLQERDTYCFLLDFEGRKIWDLARLILLKHGDWEWSQLHGREQSDRWKCIFRKIFKHFTFSRLHSFWHIALWLFDKCIESCNQCNNQDTSSHP